MTITLRMIIIKLGAIKSTILLTMTLCILSVAFTGMMSLIFRGEIMLYSIIISLVIPAVSVPPVSMLFIRLIIKLDETEKKMYQKSITDELTGSYNRRFMMEILEKEMHRARRFHHKLSLIMLDLDDFKKINDEHGHLKGDLVLKELSNLCIKSMREIDYFARYGGEEFLFVFPETSKEEATIFAERLRISIMNIKIPVEDKTISFTASIGVTELDFEKDFINNFIERVDMALYEAKRKGKNIVVTR